jgi:hypothetical protein
LIAAFSREKPALLPPGHNPAFGQLHELAEFATTWIPAIPKIPPTLAAGYNPRVRKAPDCGPARAIISVLCAAQPNMDA